MRGSLTVLVHNVFAGDILTDFPFIEASFGLPASMAVTDPASAPRRHRGRMAGWILDCAAGFTS